MLIVGIQVVHDFVFYLFFMAVPKESNYMIAMFKDYAKENGIKALIADSCMIIVASLIASQLKNVSLNNNIILLIGLIYMVPYLIYIKK